MASDIPTPRHLWVVGLLGLVFGSVGAMDYSMTQTHNAEYLAGFAPELLEFSFSLPPWVVASWAIAVWGSVAGCLLLLARRRLAVPVFAASMVGTALTTIHNFGMSNGLEVMGSTESLIITALIQLFAIGLWLYARWMARRAFLR